MQLTAFAAAKKLFTVFALLENIIRFHIEAVIAALIGLVCLIGGVVLYYSAFKKPEEPDHEADLRRIEDAIEKLLQKDSGVRTAVAPTGGASGETLGIAEGDQHVVDNPVAANLSGDIQVQIDLLSAELESKKKEIEGLKRAAEQDSKTPELLAKIKHLEDRLAEYEIIEDDIADLSKFKEENARLKRQLESMATGAASSEEDVFSLGEEKEEAQPATAQSDDQSFAQAVEELGAESIDDAQPDSPATTTDEVQLAKVEDVDQELTSEVKSSASNEEDKATADMLAELIDDEEESEVEDPLAALGDIDTSKMLEEIQGLSDQAAALELDDVPDLKKMAEEADDAEEKK